MKKTIALLLCGAGLILAPALHAQTSALANDAPPGPPPPPPHGRPNMAEMLARSLALNEDQKAQVRTLADAAQPQLDAIRQQAREAESAVIKQLNAQIRPLLNEEQQTRLDTLEAERAARPPGPPPR